MINDISVNSNNTIELSRGELLAWLNEMTNANITKIQQLGTGAVYCQLLDLLYPGKIQLSKVNFKAKNDYEYINNFKLLQQHFTKLSIMKNIEVEKLIKCKYQDNLQFLQWFKKIFDKTEPETKRSLSDNDSHFSLDKENKKPTRALNFDDIDPNKGSINQLLKLQFAKQNNQRSTQTSTSRPRQDLKMRRQNSFLKLSTQRYVSESSRAEKAQNMEVDCNVQNSGVGFCQKQNLKIPFYSPSKFIQKQNFFLKSNQNQGFCNEERQFYLSKISEIEHLLEFYEKNQNCSKLVLEIRKIILIPPNIKGWFINDQTGELVCEKSILLENHDQVTNFALDSCENQKVKEVDQL